MPLLVDLNSNRYKPSSRLHINGNRSKTSSVVGLNSNERKQASVVDLNDIRRTVPLLVRLNANRNQQLTVVHPGEQQAGKSGNRVSAPAIIQCGSSHKNIRRRPHIIATSVHYN